MKYLVVPQKLHSGEIQTVSLSASNKLVATGGKDRMLSIWNAEELTRLTRAEPASSISVSPSESIAVHENTVKLIRWNPTSESLLISASASGVLILSDLESSTHTKIYPPPNWSTETPSPILDGCWSSDGRLFAWSTLNGKVHIHDTKKETYQCLMKGEAESTGKKSVTQQSIAFGPTFSCLICLGDDMLVKIFEYSYDHYGNYEFKMTREISKFIGNSVADTSHISHKRISWSCDGELVAVSNAANQQSSLITLLSTSHAWQTKVSLFGHDTLCNSVIFGPKILQSDPPAQVAGAPPYTSDFYHIIATTGVDKTLVLWNTSKELPIAVIKNTSQKPVSEMSWFKSGQDLISVTLDGHILLVSFTENELGREAPQKVLEDIVASQKILMSANRDANEKDSPASKKLKMSYPVVHQMHAKRINVMQQQNQLPENESQVPAATKEKKVEKSKTSQVNVTDITPQTPSSEPVKSTKDNIPSCISAEVNKVKKTTAKTPQEPAVAVQKVTSKDGKKRIQPVLISNNDPKASTSQVSTSKTAQSVDSKPAMEFTQPSLLAPEDQAGGKKKKASDNGASKKVKKEVEPVKYIGSVVTNPNTTFAKARLSAPRVRHEFRVADSTSFLDIKNGQGNEGAPSRISNFKNELQVWTDFIPRFLQLAVRGDEFWAVSTADGQIITYAHTSGKRLLPPLVLGSPISFLESNGKFLMAVTCIAEVYVWDLEQKKSHIKAPSSLAALLDLNMKFKEDVLSKSDSITMCSITSRGIPLVTLSNGSGYMYNRDMEVWQTVTETWWAFGSHYWDSIGDENISEEAQPQEPSKNAKESSLISLLEHRTNEELLRKSRTGRGKYFSKLSKNMIMKEGFENLENTISLSHLENRILCCELLGEQVDFRNFLSVYMKRLCELGLKAKLFEICELVLGAQADTTDSKLCGLDRKQLLKEIILECAEYRDAQRILVHFGQKVGLIELEYS